MQGLWDTRTNLGWAGIVGTQEKAKRISYTLFIGKAEGETLIEDGVTENWLKQKPQDERGERQEGRALCGQQEERMGISHVSNMVLGCKTQPAVSLVQFKPPSQNLFAVGGAAVYLSGLRLYIHVLIIRFTFVCFLCFLNDYLWSRGLGLQIVFFF